MGYILNLLPQNLKHERAKGPARFVIEICGVQQKQFGILFANTARKLASGYPSYVEIMIRELTEAEVMHLLMNGWRQGG